jgi:hypothetical protein
MRFNTKEGTTVRLPKYQKLDYDTIPDRSVTTKNVRKFIQKISKQISKNFIMLYISSSGISRQPTQGKSL